jgi:hypothetical protein
MKYQPYYAMLACTYSMHACKPYNGTYVCGRFCSANSDMQKDRGHTDDKTGMDAVWGTPPGIERIG